MWLLTDLADAFDREVREGEEIFDTWGNRAALDLLHDNSHWNTVRLQAVAWGYAGFKLSTTVGSGYVDVLRIGDGVKKGGWGYAEDALRALVVVGPALRAARGLSGSLRRIDVLPAVGNCTWVASTKALRLTGTRMFAKLSDLAAKAGIPIGQTAGAFISELLWILRSLGARVSKLEGSGQRGLDSILKAARANPYGVVVFSVKWESVGHTLLARATGRGVRILDRSGRSVKDLAGLESSYAGISKAQVYDSAFFIHDALPVTLLENVSALAAPFSSLADQIALPVLPVAAWPVPTDLIGQSEATAAGTGPGSGQATATGRPGQAGSGAAAAPRSGTGAGKAKSGAGSRSAGSGTRRRFDQRAVCDKKSGKCSVVHMYKTRPGDSLQAISQSAYGTPDDWRLIWSDNLGRIPRSTTGSQSLKPGIVLTIPTFR